jgi:hypothetical protein
VEEVESVGDMYLLVFSLHPSELIDDFVAPLVHALVSDVHLGVEDPQEAEALHGQMFHRDVDDLLVAHRRVVQVELIVREHETRVVSLSTLNPPWRVDVDHLEVTQLVH